MQKIHLWCLVEYDNDDIFQTLVEDGSDDHPSCESEQW